MYAEGDRKLQNMQTKEVLAKLVLLTGERDGNSLELSLAQTLFDLVVPERVILYHALQSGSHEFSVTSVGATDQVADISEALRQDLMLCTCTGQSMTHLADDCPALMLYPLRSVRHQVVAVVAIDLSGHTPEAHQTIEMLLKIYHNFIDLINDNERDTLTGLLNRKTFERRMNNIKARQGAVGERRVCGEDGRHYLAIFDIDHFKHVNDNHGHLIGDEVLLLFSQLLSKAFREHDLLFRFGGEEFIGVFSSHSATEMQVLLDRFRLGLQAFSFPQVGQITASIGFTEISAFDASASMVDRADVALYYAKNNGRNRVCHYEQLVGSGALQENRKEGEIELF